MGYEKVGAIMIDQQLSNKLDDHESRIRILEIREAETGQKIENLVEKLDTLIVWIKALVVIGATSFISFFFWYIQNLK